MTTAAIRLVNAARKIRAHSMHGQMQHRVQCRCYSFVIGCRTYNNMHICSEFGCAYEKGRAMQARLLERPQQVSSIKKSASRAEAPRNPATTRPRMYPDTDNACRPVTQHAFAETQCCFRHGQAPQTNLAFCLA